VLADFGLRWDDLGMDAVVQAVMAHQSPEGAFETRLRLYRQFGGRDGEFWTWMNCDGPTLLYSLLSFGLANDDRVQRAVDHLIALVGDQGWSCGASGDFGNFDGPGRRGDPCPIANVYALKALSALPGQTKSPTAGRGAEMLLWHWQVQKERKVRMFGIGTDFRKLKYPFVWYDILHVADVLSRFPFARDDPRLREMVGSISSQADGRGRYTAQSMYMAWKGWSFADKKHPSPWVTFLVQRIHQRMAVDGQ
jgi:hypothetical protein